MLEYFVLLVLLLRWRKRLRSIVMSTSVCVCLSVCLSVREDISETTCAICTKLLPMAVARSSSGVVVICYVLSVSWMTSGFFL